MVAQQKCPGFSVHHARVVKAAGSEVTAPGSLPATPRRVATHRRVFRPGRRCWRLGKGQAEFQGLVVGLVLASID